MLRSRFTRGLLAACVLACWTLTAGAQASRPQDGPKPVKGVKSADVKGDDINGNASRPRDPRARWNALSDADKERYRKLFYDLRKLPESERALVKERLNALVDERKKLETNLTPPDRAVLESLDGEAREMWLQKAAAEVLRDRHDRMSGLVDKEKVKAAKDADPKRRRQVLSELSKEAAREAVRRFADYAKRRKVLTAEEADQLRALPIAEAAPRIAALKKQMVVDDVARKPELRAEVGDETWEQVKALPPEQFLQRIEAMRAFHKSAGHGHGDRPPRGGPGGPPGSKPGMGRPPHGGSRGGPAPGGAEFEAKMRDEARKVLKAQGLTDAEIEKKIADGPIWKLLRPKPGEHDGRHGHDSGPASRRGG